MHHFSISRNSDVIPPIISAVTDLTVARTYSIDIAHLSHLRKVTIPQVETNQRLVVLAHCKALRRRRQLYSHFAPIKVLKVEIQGCKYRKTF